MGMSNRRRESFREFLLALEAKQNSQLISEEKAYGKGQLWCVCNCVCKLPTSICHSIDPSTVAFSERSLRRHIHECLQSGKMTPFPHTRFLEDMSQEEMKSRFLSAFIAPATSIVQARR